MAVNEASIDSAREIAATRVFDAPRDLVFRMWTEPEHVAQWWGPRGFTNTIHAMDVRAGGTWDFIMHGPDGTDYKNKIVYREVKRPERLAYSHVSGPVFDVVVDFIDEGLGDRTSTRVEMRMIFATAEQRNQVAEDYGAVEGLQQTLDRLEEKLVSSDDPFVFSRTFDAPRELMFDVWTDVNHLSRWFGPKGAEIVSATNDLRPGGIFHYGMRIPDGTVIWGRWIYREITRPERLVFLSSFSDDAKGVTRHPFAPQWPLEMLSTVLFTESDGKTTVTVYWSPIHATDVERTTFAEGKPSMTQGWTGTFENLEAYVKELA